MKEPENGDPELRIRIPVRGPLSTRVAKGKGYVAVGFGLFLNSSITLEIHDRRAVQKLQEALAEADGILVAQEQEKTAQRLTKATQPKKGKKR